MHVREQTSEVGDDIRILRHAPIGVASAADVMSITLALALVDEIQRL